MRYHQQCIQELSAATLPIINVPSQIPPRTERKYPTFIVIIASILKPMLVRKLIRSRSIRNLQEVGNTSKDQFKGGTACGGIRAPPGPSPSDLFNTLLRTRYVFLVIMLPNQRFTCMTDAVGPKTTLEDWPYGNEDAQDNSESDQKDAGTGVGSL